MLPIFPAFDKVNESNFKILKEYTLKFEPYSDFNPTSLYANNFEVSSLNGNLIVKFSHYTMGKKLLSLLGNNDISKTVYQLFSYISSGKEELNPKLEYVPQSVIDILYRETNAYIAIEDIDNHDYIFNISDLVSLKNKDLSKCRYLVNKFKSLYSTRYEFEHTFTVDIFESIKKVLNLWAKSNIHQELEDDLNAILKLRDIISFNGDLSILVLYDDNNPIAFSLEEPIDNEYIMAHFGKADKSYTGVYQYIEWLHANYWMLKGYKYLNYEQDLGIEGLRISKNHFGKARFLKKYSIQKA